MVLEVHMSNEEPNTELTPCLVITWRSKHGLGLLLLDRMHFEILMREQLSKMKSEAKGLINKGEYYTIFSTHVISFGRVEAIRWEQLEKGLSRVTHLTISA